MKILRMCFFIIGYGCLVAIPVVNEIEFSILNTILVIVVGAALPFFGYIDAYLER